MKKIQIVWAGIAVVLAIFLTLQAQETAIPMRPVFIHAPVLSSEDDLATMIQAVELTTPQAADSAPTSGTFWSAQNPNFPPFPGNLNNTPVWNLGDNVWLLDDLDIDYTARTPLFSRGGGGMHAMDEGPPSPGDGGDDTNSSGGGGFSPAISFPTNSLWLQITNVSSGLAYLNLMNGTDSVYEIYSTVALVNGSNAWDIAAEVWPTNPTVMPFTVPATNPTNLFIWARDWTGITSLGNTVPEWWFWKYFGTVDSSDTNLDSQGETLLHDYTNSLDPNVIAFYFNLPLTTVSSNSVNSTINVIFGTPAYMAILVNDTNEADAVWQPYTTSNIVVNLFSGNGVYNVMVGLRGLPADATQTWQSNRVSLYAVLPSLTITNPTSSTISVPMIQLQGLVNEGLSNLTFDVSNAVGVVTNQQGYWQPALYDTNLLTFTTNSFQCYDVALTNGVNLITLHATDAAGNTTTTSVSYTLSYAGITNPPTLNLIWPTNGTVMGGSNFTMQAQISDATAMVVASIVDTNGDTNIVQGLVERSGAVWVNDLPLAAGTNLLTLTATSAAGNVTTTNLTLVQSSVLVTLDPLVSGQFNQAFVDVTGTISDPSEDVCIQVNGTNAYYLDDVGDWEADHVPVNPTGTATFDVELYTNDPVNIGSQVFQPPQPAVVSLMSYTAHYMDDVTYYNYCSFGPATEQIGNDANWLYQSGGAYSGYTTGISDCAPANEHDSTGLTGGFNGYEPGWECLDDIESLVSGSVGGFLAVNIQTTNIKSRAMIVPSGQQAIGQSALYLVMAQVMDEDTGEQLAASAVQFMHQLAGSATEDVTNADGSVWTEAVVSGPAGAPIEATPIAAGNISFTGMKISKMVFFSVTDNGNVPAGFRSNVSAVESKLHSELVSQVFTNLTTDTDVQIKVVIENAARKWGWDSSAKQTYYNQVNFGFGNVAYNNFASNNHKGDIEINLNPIVGTDVTAQGWVNYFAHEGIWGNVAGQHDCIYIPLIHDCTDYEISSGTQSYDDSNPFTVSPNSRLTILNACGLISN